MTRRTRRFLFLFFLILFLLITPLIVFYSLGWRIDWRKGKVLQTGAFYFKVWPKNCQIYINGKFKKKTDFFFGAALIENLLPKKYNLEIKKEGFQTWQKTLEIQEKQATEIKNIILLPEKPNFGLIAKEVERFFFSPDEKKVIFSEASPTSESQENSSWSLKLLELEKNIKSHLIDEKSISKEGKSELFDLKFSPDSRMVLLEAERKEKLNPVRDNQDQEKLQRKQISNGVNYYILEMTKEPLSLIPLDFLPSNIDKIIFYPENHQRLLILKEGEVKEVDLVTEKVSKPLLEEVITLLPLNNNLYYFNSSGFLYRTDFSFKSHDRLNQIPFPIKQEVKYQIKVFNSYFLLRENDILYFLNKEGGEFKKFFEPLKNLIFSPDSKKMAYWSDYEIWVLFLEERHEQPRKQAGEQLFLTRFSEKIDRVFWLTNYYLVFSVGDKIKIAEIDDRDRINIWELGEFKKPEIFWSQINKEIFILSEKNLYSLENLVP